MRGDLDHAIADCQRINDVLRAWGDAAHASTTILEQALLMLERGDAEDTVLPLVEEGETYTSPHDAGSVSFGAACRAILAVRAHDHERATELAGEAMRVVDDTQALWTQADLRRWLSEVPRTTGDVALECRMLLAAKEMYRRKEIHGYDFEIGRRVAEFDEEETDGS